ncbi:EAL domain-containing protein [Fusibacter sp. JL216-2]|uniref:EAL domain-containing protein n=1 Tax=Fusibacter sp. JL216-2 TaxID=3071453 RepID=UPI003D337D69
MNCCDWDVHYQNIVDIKSGKTKFYEALLRVKNREIEPFIRELEMNGSIADVTEFMLLRSADFLRSLSEDISLTINISPLELDIENYSSRLIKIIKSQKLDASRLVFEITESRQMVNSFHAKRNMDALKAIGIRFAMDDFGMGYSNILLLASYPFDYVKMDKCFLNDILVNNKKQYILQNILCMLEGLGISTIVEGVEGCFEYKLLKNFSVDYVQGYYLGKPMPLLTCSYKNKSFVI